MTSLKRCKFCYILQFTGSDIMETTIHENEVYSEYGHRINVDTDWADGLTSR